MCVMVDLWFAEYGTRHRLGKIGDGIRICEFITFSCENSIFCWCVCGVWVGFSNSCRGEYRAGSSAGSISACSSVWKFIFNGSAPDKGKCYEEFMWLYLPIFEFRNHDSCLWTKCCLAQNFLYALFSIFLSVIISWSMYFDIYLFCIILSCALWDFIWHFNFYLQRCAAQMLLLAGPGVVISTFFVGSALKVVHIECSVNPTIWADLISSVL